MSQPIYGRVALIGLGLIASSMAHAMRQSGLAGSIAGHARSAETRAAAREIGFCDEVFATAAEAVEGADLVVLAVPVGAMGAVAAEIGAHLKPGATVTDVGSVKQAVVEAVAPHIPEGVHFIPGHPLAGTEHSGPYSGFATLFENRWCLLIPGAAAPEAVARLRTLLAEEFPGVEVLIHPDPEGLVDERGVAAEELLPDLADRRGDGA